MLHSLLRHPGNAILIIAGFTLLASSFKAHSDSRLASVTPRLSDMHVKTMDSKELATNTGWLVNNDYLLDAYEANVHEMNARWLEDGMEETPDYHEGGDALQELTKSALKNLWKELVDQKPHYDRYTPMVNGNFSGNRNGADYDVRLSGNTIRFRVEYPF